MDVPSLPQRTTGEQRGREGEREKESFLPVLYLAVSASLPPPNPPSFLFSRDRTKSRRRTTYSGRSVLYPSYLPGVRSTDWIEDLVSLGAAMGDAEGRRGGRARSCVREHGCHDRIKPSAISFDSISRVRRIYIGGGKLR